MSSIVIIGFYLWTKFVCLFSEIYERNGRLSQRARRT